MRLRTMEEDDAAYLLEIFSDPAAMKYYPSTKDRHDTLEWIKWTQDNYRKFGMGMWVAEMKETGQFAGQCGLVPQKIADSVELELGYLFARKHWGKGLATEAALACKNYGFQQLGLERIISLIDPENLSSVKVAERAGLSFEKEIVKWGKLLCLYSVHHT
ncbi:GNAT family N-acetyltransferase [Bacillus marinisedimentorum]|uniref:GNAT family N-acetyltransferase n=1 Tax=Bacillus marinisedimentorum TaxID=1821260 RepID=UPI003CCB834C